jgi:hypothetical protein
MSAALKLTNTEKLQQELMAEHPDWFTVNSKFVAKLSYADRCSLYAFGRIGVKVPVLSLAFGVNRATVRHVMNPSSPHYKNVRKEYAEHPEDFIKRFITPEWRRKIELATANVAETMHTDAELAKRPRDKLKRANTAEGHHYIVFDEAEGFVTRQYVLHFYDTLPDGSALPPTFLGDPRPPGWYLLVVDPDAPYNTMMCSINGSPLFGDPKNSATSAKALAGYLAETGAKEAEL